MFKHIGRLYLELYATSRNLKRPLTKEQLVEAADWFHRTLIYQEADLDVAQWQGLEEIEFDTEPMDVHIGRLVSRYKRENNIVRAIDRVQAKQLCDKVQTLIEDGRVHGE